jgi:hypothetical protein
MSEAEELEHGPWPERAILLAGLGALCGLAVYILTDGGDNDGAFRVAGATFLVVGGILLAFSVERLRWAWSAAFAAGGGLIVALIALWSGTPSGWSADEGWRLFASVVAVAVAVPLFQAARDVGGRRFGARPVHAHAWTNLILWGAAWAFVGAAMLLALLLAELFNLIGLDLLRRALQDGWFPAMIVGGAFGGAVGLLRDRDSVLATLQKVARAILSVLAPVLAIGLLLFVLALPFTGLEPLWSKTKATTPLVLACILAATVLANAVAGNGPDEEARPPLRWAGAGLIGVMLPLAAVAAVSLAKRIGQYGFTPERLWAAVFVLVAAAFAVGYLVALLRARREWPEAVRRINVRLAAGVCLLALFLALPIVSFGSISARDQLARLRDGRTPADRFDWAAMRFDFGPAGVRALRELAASAPAQLRGKAVEALRADSRWAIAGEVAEPMRIPESELRLTALPAAAAIAPALRDSIARSTPCRAQCRVLFERPERAVVVGQPCDTCAPFVHVFVRTADGGWAAAQPIGGVEPPLPPGERSVDAPHDAAALERGSIEVRTVEKRQVFVGGRPIGPVFDP